jgi:hypothetical protein
MSDETDITTTIGNRPAPTLARLHELLTFDPTAGKFSWRVQRGRARAGRRGGDRSSLRVSAHRDRRRLVSRRQIGQSICRDDTATRTKLDLMLAIPKQDFRLY